MPDGAVIGLDRTTRSARAWEAACASQRPEPSTGTSSNARVTGERSPRNASGRSGKPPSQCPQGAVIVQAQDGRGVLFAGSSAAAVPVIHDDLHVAPHLRNDLGPIIRRPGVIVNMSPASRPGRSTDGEWSAGAPQGASRQLRRGNASAGRDVVDPPARGHIFFPGRLNRANWPASEDELVGWPPAIRSGPGFVWDRSLPCMTMP